MALPPGPSARPVVQTLRWTIRPVAMLERCTRDYGDCFTMRLLPLGDVVVLSDPAAIKDVFQGDPELLHAGEANTVLEPVVGSRSVLLLDGAEHMRQRKLMLPAFHGERMQRYGELIAEITERQVESWPIDEPFPLRPRMQAITLEVIMRAIFGVDERARLDRLGDALRKMLDLTVSRFVLVNLPLVGRYRGPGSAWRAFDRAVADVDRLLFEEIRRRRDDPAAADRDDVLSMLLQARDERGEPLTETELRDELVTLLVAGHETTATALAWAFERLLRRPASLARLTEEVTEMNASANGEGAAAGDGSGDGTAGEGGYLDAVVKETLRLRPVLMLVLRRLTQPLEVAGHDLPAGTNVAPCVYLVHRRPDIYPDPAAFRPERFLERPAGTYSWIPFGGGVRRCIGASFATYEMKVVMSTILRRAQLRAPATDEFERPRRRSVTMAPDRDARVVLDARGDSARRAPPASAARSSCASSIRRP